MTEPPLLNASSLVRRYRRHGSSEYHAVVNGVSIEVQAGETFGIIGSSGAGKSTLVRLLLGLEKPDEGTVEINGHDLFLSSRRRLRTLRRQFQPVFQDSTLALNPRLTVETIIIEPMLALGTVDRSTRHTAARRLLDTVGLPESTARRRPTELSGGQRQRVALARALSCQPRLLILDEPVASLDVRSKWLILAHLSSLQRELGLAIALVSHDTDVIRFLCSRAGAIERGRLIAEGDVKDVLATRAGTRTRSRSPSTP